MSDRVSVLPSAFQCKLTPLQATSCLTRPCKILTQIVIFTDINACSIAIQRSTCLKRPLSLLPMSGILTQVLIYLLPCNKGSLVYKISLDLQTSRCLMTGGRWPKLVCWLRDQILCNESTCNILIFILGKIDVSNQHTLTGNHQPASETPFEWTAFKCNFLMLGPLMYLLVCNEGALMYQISLHLRTSICSMAGRWWPKLVCWLHDQLLCNVWTCNTLFFILGNTDVSN